MIVEDDFGLLSMLELGLAAEGLKPIWTATTGELALKVLVTHRPDYVLLDYQLPRMSGESVGLAVRRLLPRTKVVVYSGTVSQTLEWADAYLLKPDVEGVVQYFRDELG